MYEHLLAQKHHLGQEHDLNTAVGRARERFERGIQSHANGDLILSCLHGLRLRLEASQIRLMDKHPTNLSERIARRLSKNIQVATHDGCYQTPAPASQIDVAMVQTSA